MLIKLLQVVPVCSMNLQIFKISNFCNIITGSYNKVRTFSDLLKQCSNYSTQVRNDFGLSDIDIQNKESGYENETYESRLLKIAIIGVPNVGKSTVINQIIGRRVCPISSKVHTTRCKARAIAIHDKTQLVFLDTPGLVTSDESRRHKLERSFQMDGEEALLEADVIGVIHDVSNIWTRDRLDPKVLRLLHLYPRKHSFLILNKIDVMKSKRKLLDIIRLITNNSIAHDNVTEELLTKVDYVEEDIRKKNKSSKTEVENDENQNFSELQVKKKVELARGWSNFKEVFMVSALTGDGINDVKDYLLHLSEPSPWLYPASQYSDQPSETIIVNTVHSKLLDNLPQEIPYQLETAMEYYQIEEEGTLTTVVLVYCSTPRIEKLVLGRRGARIRTVARQAEQELQDTFKQPVRLKVVVTNKNNLVSKKNKKV